MNFKLQFRVHEGEGLLKISEAKMHPLVQDFLYENDYVLLVAKEKIGKSILALQLACCISSGTPFLGMLEVPMPQRVWYFATEGKDDDTKQRLINMSKKVPLNINNFKLICSAGLRINTREGLTGITSLVNKYIAEPPKVIIIDPLYMAVRGSLKDDDIINDFTHVMRKVSEECDAAVVIVHHSRRPIRYTDGSILDAGDDEIFGSAFLKASADHIFYMGKIQGTDNKFVKCETQRTGNIIDVIQLRLNEPSPLFFEYVDRGRDKIPMEIKNLLEKHGELTVKQLSRLLSVSTVSIYTGLHKLLVTKTNTRPVKYQLGRSNGNDCGLGI